MGNTNELTISQAQIEDFEELILFNKEMYPDRHHTAEFFKYRYLNEKTPGKLSDVVIAKWDDQIIGQRMVLQNKVALNEKIYDCNWVNDMIVKPEFRGKGVANGLVKKLTEIYPSFSSLNTVEQSIKMYEKIGSKRINKLKLYIKPLNFLSFSSFLTKLMLKKETAKQSQLPKIDYPGLSNEFSRIHNSSEIVNQNYNWNNDWIESLRTQDVIDWRFFYKPDVYGFYQLNHPTKQKNPAYFIVRPIFWKGMNCLMMVDARYNIGSGDDLLIAKATKKIAKKNRFDAILWGTTIPSTQKKLAKFRYIKYAELPMTCNLKISDQPLQFVAHFADSDLDFNYSNTPFVYGG